MVNDGYSAPFMRIYYKDLEVTEKCVRLKYVYDEEDDDDIELHFETDIREDLDLPQFQEGAELKVIWGFIGGKISPMRTITVQECKPSLSRDNIKIQLSCSEKGISLKGSTGKVVHKGKTLPQIVSFYADKHGLKAKAEITEEGTNIEVDLQTVPGERLDQYLIRLNKAKTAATVEFNKKNPQVEIKKNAESFMQQASDPDYLKEQEIRRKYGGYGPAAEAKVQGELQKYRLAQWGKQFQPIQNAPQAGKSDKQFLNDLGLQQKDGPYMVETRDNAIILKKRSFMVKPVATYTYGVDAELLDFNPETKKKKRKGNASGVGYSGWNGLDKTFHQGTATAADGNPTLARAMAMLKFYKGIKGQDSGKGGQLITSQILQNTHAPITGTALEMKVDNIGRFGSVYEFHNITVDDKVSFLEKVIDGGNQSMNDEKKDFYSSLGVNPQGAYDHAANLRRNSELNSNPGNLTIWGNPEIQCGHIVNIQGAGKKYSGNYYIKKCSHEIDKNGYLVECDIRRQGTNIKSHPKQAFSKELGRPLNNSTGDAPNKENEVPLLFKENPKNFTPLGWKSDQPFILNRYITDIQGKPIK